MVMWRKLTDAEKQELLMQYQAGTYLLRGVLGFWLLFVTLYLWSGAKTSIESLASGDMTNGLIPLVGVLIAGLFFCGIPIYIIATTGTKELKDLRNNEAYIRRAIYISHYVSTHRTKYIATVHLLDEFGNSCEEIECKSEGDPKKYCKQGDIIEVLHIGDRYICLPKNKIESYNYRFNGGTKMGKQNGICSYEKCLSCKIGDCWTGQVARNEGYEAYCDFLKRMDVEEL